MKTQIYQQKSENLQGNWLELCGVVCSKKKHFKQCDVKKTLASATLCTDLQSIS